ncbi:cytochrome c5 family protein [Pseudomaricurvus sp. HS19]|uniref:c-type cytochrome n=1 Tax=Pseudomaricurvus sp. HS19 TaxID=2692626 RepID=UPI00136F3E3B|nr:c-type cytochrome [Pseudomaricurvus sp. HS19]MYM64563.1 c-type cytochrome [Pseudomaricurvus sp. HS19]
MSQAEELYRKNCKVCHAQGINGAPIVGNQKMWGPRAAQGVDVLVEHAVNGFGLMPPRGGSALTDEEIRKVVEYYLSQLQ